MIAQWFHTSVVVLRRGAALAKKNLKKFNSASQRVGEATAVRAATSSPGSSDIAVSSDKDADRAGVTSIQESIACKQMELLDAMSSAAVLLRASGEVVCYNRTFSRLPQGGITLRAQKLTATESRSNARLQRMVRKAMATTPTAEEMCTVILMRDNSSPLLATLLIVHRHLDRPQSNCAILLITDPDDRSRPDEAVLRGAFGLTPAEVQLAQSLVSGEKPDDPAVRSKVSRQAVTRPLKAIFKKTKLHRRSELIRLLISLRAG
jgi:DNA-binding CsgD family transcriptional regulator